MSKREKGIVAIVLAVAIIAGIVFYAMRKQMVYAKIDFPFETDGTKILAGTRLGELDKIEGNQVIVKNNKYSILKMGFAAGVQGVDVEIRKEFA